MGNYQDTNTLYYNPALQASFIRYTDIGGQIYKGTNLEVSLSSPTLFSASSSSISFPNLLTRKPFTSVYLTSVTYMKAIYASSFNTSGNAQELVKAVMDMEIASGRTPNCTCSHTPPEDASEATPTEPCSPAPGLALPASQPSAQIVTTLSTQQGPPPKSPDAQEQPETAPASKQEFKIVNEVYVSNRVIKLWLIIHLGGMRNSLSTRFRNL